MYSTPVLLSLENHPWGIHIKLLLPTIIIILQNYLSGAYILYFLVFNDQEITIELNSFLQCKKESFIL